MKLRLPHRFQAALLAAIASVSFTTLSTGTLGVATGAALLAGQQAQANYQEQITTNSVTVGGTTYTSTAADGVRVVKGDSSDSTSFSLGDGVTAEYTFLTSTNTSGATNQGRYKVDAAAAARMADYGTIILANGTADGVTYNGGQIYVGANGVTLTNDFIIGTSSYAENNWNGAFRLSANETFTGSITLAQNAKITVGNAGNTFTGTVSGTGKSLELGQSGTLTFAGDLTLDALNAGSASVVFSGSHAVISSSAQNQGIHQAGGTVTVGGGAGTTLMELGRLELGDAQGGSSALNVLNGATLKITGSNNNENYKQASFILGEWSIQTTATIGGTVLSKDADVRAGDTGGTINIASTGTLAAKGIRTSKSADANRFTVNVNGGRLILGATGVIAQTLNLNNNATVGTYAGSTNITGPTALNGLVSFDTQQYAFTDDGNNVGYASSGTTAITVTGDTTIAGGAHLSEVGDGSVALNGSSIDIRGTLVTDGDLSIGTASSSITVGGTITNSGNLSLAGTLTLPSSGSYEVFGEIASGDFSGIGDFAGSGYRRGNDTQYYLVHGGDTSSITSTITLSGGSIVDGAGVAGKDVIIKLGTASESDKTYYVNTDIAYNGTEMADATSILVTPSGTLSIGGSDAASLLNTKIAGSGTVVVNADTTITGGGSAADAYTTHATGTLRIAKGKHLTLGTDKNNQYLDFSSFSAVELEDGAAINLKQHGMTLNNVSVASGTAHIGQNNNSDDTFNKDIDAVTLLGTTLVDGELQMGTQWKWQMSIDKLAGSGTLVARGANETHRLIINSAEDFDGTLKYSGGSTEIVLRGSAPNGDLENTGGGNTLKLDAGASNAVEFGHIVDKGGSLTIEGTSTLKAAELANGTGSGSNVGGAVSVNTSSQIDLVRATGGTLTFGGTDTTHEVKDFKLAMNQNVATAAVVGAGATLHITGAEIASVAGEGSFLLSHWPGASTLTINGTLISEAVMSAWDGAATINVENGGTLELRKGLNRNSGRSKAIDVNVKDGATLVAGTADGGVNSDSVHVNMNGGSTLKGYYGEGTSAVIDKALSLGSGTVTMDVDAGKNLQLNGSISGAGSVNKTGAGTLTLSGTDSAYSGNVSVNAGTLALMGTLTTTGSLTFAENTTLDLSYYSGTISTTPTTVASATGGITGFDGGMYIAPTAPKGMEAAVTLNNNEIQVSYIVKQDATMHLYILTGQSNSLGSVKGNPAPADLFAQYASGGLLYNGNMHKGGSRYVAEPDWKIVDVQPKGEGDSSYAVTGPEYVFQHLMIEKGWFSNTPDKDSIGVIKASLDGGGDEFWVKDGANSNYGVVLDTVIKGYQEAEALGYGSVTIDGLLYLQGESNTHGGELVQTRYTAFLTNLKADLEAAKIDTTKIKFGDNSILGEPATWGQTDTSVGNEKSAGDTHTQLENLAADSNKIGFVYTRDLDKINPGDGMGVHYNGEAQITIGARYAYAFAVQNGKDVSYDLGDGVKGVVRGDNDEKALTEAGAWWKGSAPTSSDVVVWDVSSVSTPSAAVQLQANHGNYIADGATFAVGGIYVADAYKQMVTINGGTISLGGAGITLAEGGLTANSAVTVRESQTWQAQNGHALAVNGTTTIGDGVTLSFADDLYLTFGAITGTGNLAIGKVTFDMDMDYMLANGMGEYVSSAGAGENGFFSGNLNLVKLTGANSQITFTGDGGSIANITKAGDLASHSIALSSDNKALQLTDLQPESTVYYARSGAVEYTASDAGQNGIYTAQQVALAGSATDSAVLTLSSALKDGVTINSEGLGGTINIASGVSLAATSVNAAGAPVAITGSGTFVGKTSGTVGSVTADDAFGTGVTLSPDWMGTVRIADTTINSGQTGIKLNELGNANSVVEFEGVKAFLNPASTTYTPNIKFSGTGLNIDAGNTAATYTFSGNISGSGNLNLSLSRGSDRHTYVFAGDVENWTGEIQAPSNKTLTVKIAGEADTVNARISRTNGTLNLVADTNTTFKAAISGLSSLAVSANKSATFESGLTTASTTLNAGSTLSITGSGKTYNLGTVNTGTGTLDLVTSVSTGNMTVAAGSTLKLAGAGEGLLTVGGALTLQAGSTLDLARIFASPVQSAPVLFSAVGGEIVAPANGNTYILATANSIGSLDGVELANIAQGYTGTLSTQDAGGSKQLILTLASTSSDLIWDNNAQNNSWTSSENWHTEDAPGTHIAFTDGDNVRFSSTLAKPSPTLGADANAGTMVIDTGVEVTLNTGSNTLTVADLDSTSGSLIVGGSGSASFGGSDDEVTLSKLQVTGGTVAFSEHVHVTGNDIIALTGNSNVTFNKGISFDGSGGTWGYAMTLANGTSATLGGVTNVSAKNIGPATGATLTLAEGAEVTALGVRSSTTLANNGRVVLSKDATLTTGGNGIYSTNLSLADGSTVNLGGDSQLQAVSGTGSIVAQSGAGTVTMTGDISGYTGTLDNSSSADVTLALGGSVGTANMKITHSGEGKVNVALNKDSVTLNGTQLVNNVTQSTSWSAFIGEAGRVTATGRVQTGRLVVGDTAAEDDAVFTLSGSNAMMNKSGTEHAYDGAVKGYGTFEVADGATQTLSKLNDGNNAFHGTLKATGTGSVLTLDSTLDSTLVSGADLYATGGGKIALTLKVTGADEVAVDSHSTLALARMDANALRVNSLTLRSDSILDLSALNLTGTETQPITLVSGGTISPSYLDSVTLNFGKEIGNEYTLGVQDNALVLTFTPVSNPLIWDHATDATWSTNSGKFNWHVEGAGDGTSAFTTDADVRFIAGKNNAVSLGEAITAGKMTLDSGVTVNLTAGQKSLTVDGLSLGAGSTLEVDPGNKGIALNLGDVEVSGSASITSKSGGWNPHVTIESLVGAAGSVLNLKAAGQVDMAGVYEMNGGAGSDFHGDIVIRQENGNANAQRVVAMNINSGAATQLADSVVTFSNVNNANARVGLGVNTDATVKGLVSDTSVSSGKHVIFSGAATVDTKREFDSNISGGSTAHTLTINTAGGDYSTRAEVYANVNLVKTGEGRQSFTSDLSAMNGAVTASAGTLTLVNNGNKGNLNSVTVDGGTLELNNMGVNNAITLSSGTLDLMSATNTGSLSMTGGKLVMDDQNWLTSTGNLAFTGGTLDLSEMTVEAGHNYILATTTGTLSLDAAMDFTLSDSSLKSQYTLQKQGNNLVLTFDQQGKDLLWQGGDDTWVVSTEKKDWYLDDGTQTPTSFGNGDNARFDSASADATVTVSGAVTAGSVAVEDGANVTIVTGNGNTLGATSGITVEGTLALDGTSISGTLSGAGVVVGNEIPSAVNWSKSAVLGDLSLDTAGWTGTVEVAGGNSTYDAPYVVLDTINQLGTADSTVRLKGVGGYFNGSNISVDIELVNPDDASPAVLVTAGNNKTTTFNGDIFGSGDLVFNKLGGSVEVFKFYGDLSAWEGALKTRDQSASDKNGALTVEFAGTDQTVNASLIQEGTRRALNVKVDNVATFTNTVDVTSVELAEGAIAGFAGAVDAANVTLGSGSTATFGNTAEIGNLKGSGNLVVNSGNEEVTISGISNYAGTTTVNSGTLYLTTTVDTIGTMTVNGGTLKLSEMGTSALVNTGTLTLGSDSTLDLSTLNISGTETTPITLVKGGTITSDYLNDVTLNFRDSSLADNAHLSVSGNSLVLTFDVAGRDLEWRDPSGTWGTANKWYIAGEGERRTTFQNGDNVSIKAPYDEVQIDLFANASAGDMTMEVVGEDRYQTNVTIANKDGGEYKLEAQNLELKAGTSLQTDVQMEVRETVQMADMTSWTINSPQNTTLAADISSTGDYHLTSITKQGDTTLVLTGDNNAYAGYIYVQDGTLAARSATALGTGEVHVEKGATLSLERRRNDMTAGALTLAGGSTIAFVGDTMLTLDSLTLSDADAENLVTWDLSRYGFSDSSSAILMDGLTSCTDDFQYTYIVTPNNIHDAALSYNNGQVILSYTMDPQRTLYWVGGAGEWSTDEAVKNWLPSQYSDTPTFFKSNDNVIFDRRAASSFVTLGEETTTVGTMTVEEGTSVLLQSSVEDATLVAQEIDVQGGLSTRVNVDAQTVDIAETGTWTVLGAENREFHGEITGTGTLVKTGVADLQLSHANTDFHGDINLRGGSITAADTHALGQGSTIHMENGTSIVQNPSLSSPLDMGGNTVMVDAANATATISANMSVADGTKLTFAGDGNVNVAGTVSGSGTISQDSYGITTIQSIDGFAGTIDINHGTLALQNVYSGDASLNLGMGGTLQFAANSSGGQTATPLTLGSLKMASGSYFDVSNITLGDVTFDTVYDKRTTRTTLNNAAILAVIPGGSSDDFPHSQETYPHGTGDIDLRMIDGVTLVGTEHFGLDDSSYARLRYIYQGDDLVVYVQAANPEGVYWNAPGPEAEWINSTTKPATLNWNTKADGTGTQTYYDSHTALPEKNQDAYFFKKYVDGEGSPVTATITMNPETITPAGDVIFGEDTKYTINGYLLKLSGTPNAGYGNKEKNFASSLIVRDGADIVLNAALQAEDGTSVDVHDGGRLVITAVSENPEENPSALLEIFNGNNAGDTEINADGFLIKKYTNDGKMHITHTGYTTIPQMPVFDEGSSTIEFITNMETGELTISTDYLVPFTEFEDDYDPNILNEGKLYFNSPDDLEADMYEYVPVRGRGEVYTGGGHGVIFDAIVGYGFGEETVILNYNPATVQASKLELDADFSTFNYGVDITDSTLVKAGKDANFFGGTGIGDKSGSLGSVALQAGTSSDKTTITFGPHAEVDEHAVPTGEFTAESYTMGQVMAGTDSRLTVEKGATVTMDGFNAAGFVPAGEIEVGTIHTGAESETDFTASLTIKGATAVDTITMHSGTMEVKGNANINRIMQEGGTLTLDKNSTLNGLDDEAHEGALTGGTVSGGTLELKNNMVLTQNAVVDVQNDGNYTIDGAGSMIDATGLELEVEHEYILFRQIVDGKIVGQDRESAITSGFMCSGDEYVKLFDVQYEVDPSTGERVRDNEGRLVPLSTLISNDEQVYHSSASGMMTLIGNDNWEEIRSHLPTDLKFDVEGHIGYGYLHTSELARQTYYVRDLYTETVAPDPENPGGDPLAADRVTLDDIFKASAVEDPQTHEKIEMLSNVVFDLTDRNRDYTDDGPYNGTLTVNRDTSVDLFSVSAGVKAAINIAEGITVTANAASPGMVGNLDLEGEGVYEIENRNDLGQNIAVRDDAVTPGREWDGTVRVTGTSTGLYIDNMYAGAGDDASTIEFNHWKGALKEGEHTVNAKILLTGTGTGEDAAAMTLTGSEDIGYTFTNTVTGEKALVNHVGDGNVALTFTGDTADWTGRYEQNTSTNDSLTFSGGSEVNAGVNVAAGTMDLTYDGTVTAVNGDVLLYSSTEHPSNLNVTYNGESPMTMSGAIETDGFSNLAITVGDGMNHAAVTFSGTFTNTDSATMTVKEDSIATIDTDASLLRVVGEEGSTVNVTADGLLNLTSTNPEHTYSQFYGVENSGTIQMQAAGGDIKLIDNSASGKTFNLGDLVLVDPAGTAAIETAGITGGTTEVNITNLTGPKSASEILQLSNDNGQGTVNYNLGGDTAYRGTIEFGSEGATGDANVVLDSNGVAANAVLKSIGTSEGTADVVVNTTNASVQGIDSAADATVGGTLYGEKAEGSTNNRKVTITGDDTYSYNGGLGANLDIEYNGDGTQTFEGGADTFSGKVIVDNGSNAAGVLEILNATSVSITDLTIGTNNTLDLNDGSNVGTAVVSGTLLAKGGSTTGGTGSASKIDGSLTLGSGSTYDVSAAGGTGGLNLNGALTIEEGAQLSSSDIRTLMGLEIGDIYDLAFGVKEVNFGEGVITQENQIDASQYFTNLGKGEYYLCYTYTGSDGSAGSNVGTVYLYKAMPEPTTSTLSLLALAALAARRRRK